MHDNMAHPGCRDSTMPLAYTSGEISQKDWLAGPFFCALVIAHGPEAVF